MDLRDREGRRSNSTRHRIYVADGPNCPFDCSPTGFAFAQTPSAINPVIVQDVLGGPFARAGGGSANTWLRLLLDLELGLPLGYGRRGPMYFARFEFGEAVVYPFPDGLALNEFALRRYRPILPNNQTGMYLTIDADAIDALVCGEPGAMVCGGPAAVAALQGHLPGWALSRHFDLPRIGNHRAIEANPGVLRRALEAGLQDAGEVEADQPGTPGICLRTIGADYPDFPMLPGMGRVVFYSGGTMGQRLSRQFPAQVGIGPRRVPQSVAAFLARNPSQGASLRIARPGTGGVQWNRP